MKYLLAIIMSIVSTAVCAQIRIDGSFVVVYYFFPTVVGILVVPQTFKFAVPKKESVEKKRNMDGKSFLYVPEEVDYNMPGQKRQTYTVIGNRIFNRKALASVKLSFEP